MDLVPLGFVAVYLVLGVVAGLLAGLLGVGGGLVIVPALVPLLLLQGVAADVVMQLAVGSSLATIVVTSIASVRAHHGRGAVRWDLLRGMVGGIAVGAAAGAWVADWAGGPLVQRLFGVFECLVALQLLFGLQARQAGQALHRTLLLPAGTVIGLVSAVLGIGGGTLTVPFLRWQAVDMRQAVGTAAAVGLPIALAGAAAFASVGWGVPGLPGGSTGFIYWPAVAGICVTSVLCAPLGARWAHQVSRGLLQRVFAAVLLAVGLTMLFA